MRLVLGYGMEVCVLSFVHVWIRACVRVRIGARGMAGVCESCGLQLVDDTFEEDEPPNFSKVFRVVVAATPRTATPSIRCIHPTLYRSFCVV